MTEAVLDGLSVVQAARALGVSEKNVRALCDRGELDYTLTPIGRVVDRASVEKMVEERA